MNGALRVLAVHGIGHQDVDASWKEAWARAIEGAVQGWNPTRQVQVSFVPYDDLFARAPLGAAGWAEAIWKLLASGVSYGLGDLLHPGRGFLGLSDAARWTAGMIAQWVDSEKLRAAANRRVLDAISSTDAEVICAHSMGSLICYDAFIRDRGPATIAGRTFVSFGSQIGNPFVRGIFGGRLVPIRARRWRHLYNHFDRIFTTPLHIPDPNFRQIGTPFDIEGIDDHDALHYLTHPAAISGLWYELAGGAAARAVERSARAFSRLGAGPARRAMLVGINDYPDPQHRLEGCVNDVFLVSSMLQECGFLADDIRVVFDRRATARGILERLEWLLDGAGAGDVRVFYYSGHGAQLPAYGAREEVDHLDECLVPCDFDWSAGRAITDNQFFELYSQLPYETRFVAILDCCHSGGMARDGGARVRGLTPPDDIRHRLLRWEPDLRMWVPRDLERGRKGIGYARNRPSYTGSLGVTHRLGRSVTLRTLERGRYVRVRRQLGHRGPYLPVILEACGENQLSYEYRHGGTPYGAFTFALHEVFRGLLERGRPITFEGLRASAAGRLAELEYDQTPTVVGPRAIVESRIPWIG